MRTYEIPGAIEATTDGEAYFSDLNLTYEQRVHMSKKMLEEYGSRAPRVHKWRSYDVGVTHPSQPLEVRQVIDPVTGQVQLRYSRPGLKWDFQMEEFHARLNQLEAEPPKEKPSFFKRLFGRGKP